MQLQNKERSRALDQYLTVEDCQAMLPQVGERLTRVPTLHKSLGTCTAAPQPCVVEYVNTPHRWYMVRFEKTGLRECYKLPRVKGQGRQQEVVADD